MKKPRLPSRDSYRDEAGTLWRWARRAWTKARLKPIPPRRPKRKP